MRADARSSPKAKHDDADCVVWHVRGLLEKYPTVFFYANT